MKSNYYLLYTLIIAVGLLAGLSWFITNQETTKIVAQLETAEDSPFEEGEEDEEQKRINAEERWKVEFEMIKNPTTGKIPEGIRQKELKAAFKTQQFKLESINVNGEKILPSIAITGRGPNNYGGRTRALGFDVRDNNIVLSGGVTSGIYRSTNGGASWTRVTPAGEIHSLTCVAQDTRAGFQDTWYAGTGEVNSSAGSGVEGASYLGFGIYKSTDNGLTWSALPSTQPGSLENFDSGFDGISNIVVDPTNGNILATALNSVIRSTDGGTSWITVLGSASSSLRTSLIYNTVSQKFYAAIDENTGASTNSGIWSSPDGASGNWTQERTAVQISPIIYTGRIVLANVANTDDIVALYEYDNNFSCTNGNTTEVGLLHFDGVSTWTSHTDEIGNCSDSYTATSTRPKVVNTQGGYNMALATKPNDANMVYLAGTEAYRYNLSTNVYDFIGGSQLEANNINLHVDQHIFMFEPSSNDIMWSGNDGGLRKTDVTGTIKTTSADDNGYDWTDRNTDYNGYQYYGVDIDPANGSNFIVGGAQDNAFTIHPVDATADEVGPTADGVDVGVISGGSDFNTHNLFLMWQNGSMVRFQNGAFATGTINPASTGFVGRFYLDADNTNYMYFPSNTGTLHRTRIAESIASSSTTGNSATGWESMTGISSAVGSNEISAMDASRNIQYTNAAYSTSDANRKLYFGTRNGKVFRLNDPAFATAATAPADITPPTASSGFVSDIAVNPLDDKEILVTYSNYGVNSVYHTSDASVASPVWTNVEGASGTAVQLASARSAMITKDGTNTIYMVGTSTGLYATDALSGSTTSWTRLGTSSDIGLAVCVEMRLRPSDNKIVLGTHGNGAFMLEFPTALPVELVSFTGQATEKGNLLNWTTSSELNNDGFEIQKSDNGRNFEKIGFVKGNGTSVENHNYNYLDNQNTTKTNYYRLKQLDFDGSFEYSDIVSITNERTIKALTLYPNPVQDNLTIENGIGSAMIYNISGQLVRTININNNKEQINLFDLPKGSYIINVEKTNGTFVNSRFIKE